MRGWRRQGCDGAGGAMRFKKMKKKKKTYDVSQTWSKVGGGEEKGKRLKERSSGWIIDTHPRCSSSLGPRRLSAALLPNFLRPLWVTKRGGMFGQLSGKRHFRPRSCCHGRGDLNSATQGWMVTSWQRLGLAFFSLSSFFFFFFTPRWQTVRGCETKSRTCRSDAVSLARSSWASFPSLYRHWNKERKQQKKWTN